MPTVRQVQVQNLMIQEISDMLYKDLKDPRLGFITITAAEITRDLRYAKVFVSIMGSEDDRDQGLAALRRASGFIRGEFTRRARLRIAPEIDFRTDDGIPRGARIFELLHDISTEPKSHESAVPPGNSSDPAS